MDSKNYELTQIPLKSGNSKKDNSQINELNESNEIDENKLYSLLLNNKRYKDYSIFGILKALYREHKINKYHYKESLQRLNNNKKLRNSVYTKAMFYLKTIKSSSKLISGLKWDRKHSKQYKQFITLTASNNLNYSVYIKSKINKVLFENLYLSSAYKDLLASKIALQFENKLKGDNKINL